MSTADDHDSPNRRPHAPLTASSFLEFDLKREIHQLHTDGRISMHVLSGRVRLRALGRTFDLRAGALLALDRDTRHDLQAIEDSARLLTIAWPGRLAT